MDNKNLITPDFLKGTYREYREYTRYYAKSFYFSSFVLPAVKRNSAYAVYAFCRFADNITDVSKYESVEYMQSKIEFLLHTLDEVYKQVETGSGFISDFAGTIRKYEIPKIYFQELVEGVSSDIYKKNYKTFEELDVYCYKVASVVGLIMSKIFGYGNEEALVHAVELGKAMQLTNILRDIADDFSLGRIYIPEEDLERFGYTEKDIENKVIDDRFVSLMKYQIERAKEYYARAEKGIPMITNDGSRYSVKMMSKIYAGILTEIEKDNYDIYSKRHFVSFRKKLIMTLAILASKFLKKKPHLAAHPDKEPVLSAGK